MQDEVSLLDTIGGLSPKDNIYIGAALGGLMIWLYWYYQKTDTGKTVEVDTSRKHITLGAFPSTVLGLISGSLVGLEVQQRGFDMQSSAIMAGATGLVAPVVVYKLMNNSYDVAIRIMKSKYFTDVMPAQMVYSMPNQQQVMQGKMLGAYGPGEDPVISAQEWDINRRVVLASLAKMQQSGRMTVQELGVIHNLLPQPYDIAHMESQALVLQQKQVELTVGDRLDLQKLILRYKHQSDEQQDVIDRQQDLIKKHETRYDPQSRLVRDAAFGAVGFLFRSIFGWL